MKKFTLTSIFFMVLLASATILLTTITMTARASDDKMLQSSDEQQFPQEMDWLEWDGTTLISRTTQVTSAEEKEFLIEWNRQNSEQATLWQLHQSGQLPETPEKDVIETEYGIVTVEKTTAENTVVPGQEEIGVEIEKVETPYGTITVEKHSFGESIGLDENTSSANLMSLSEYTDVLNQSCGSNGVEFNFGSNNTQSNYELHWSSGSYSHYVTCSSSSCTFKITTSWSAYYTWAKAYTTSPGYVYGFGFNDYRCR